MIFGEPAISIGESADEIGPRLRKSGFVMAHLGLQTHFISVSEARAAGLCQEPHPGQPPACRHGSGPHRYYGAIRESTLTLDRSPDVKEAIRTQSSLMCFS
jgi:hypothetical protein